MTREAISFVHLTKRRNCWTPLAAAALMALFSGCAEQRRPRAPYPWATMTAVRPRVPVPAPGYIPPSPDEDAPDLRWDIPAPPLKLAATKPPARPRATLAAPAEINNGSPPDAVSLVPQLSPQEITAAKEQMNESVSVAQNSLAAAKGRQLNAAQVDLVSKINSFIGESRAAAREGDWNRARNLAKKAQVLGDELAKSL